MNNFQCNNLNVLCEQKYLHLPSTYLKDTHICSYDPDKGYVIRMKLSTREEFFVFMNKWSIKTLTKWRVRKSDPKEMCAGLKNVFWQAYHCQNTSYRLQSRSTGCKAAFKVTIRKINQRSRSKDAHIPEYPAIIIGHFRHNHAAMFNSSRKFDSKGMPKEVVQKFIELYNSGLPPTAAVKAYKVELEENYSGCHWAASKALYPDRQWCQRLYAHVKRKKLCLKTKGDENEDALTIIQDKNQRVQFYLKHSTSTLQSLSSNNNALNIAQKDPDTEHSEDLKQFTFFTNYIKQKMDQSHEFCDAVKEFNTSCIRFTSDMELLKALSNFGTAHSNISGKKMRTPVLNRRKPIFLKNGLSYEPHCYEEIFLTEENDHTYSQWTFWNKS